MTAPERTTTRRPLQLRVDSVITAYPDPRAGDRFGKSGRWHVTAPPEQFGEWVRVDHHGGVWFLPIQQDLTVELQGVELVTEAARLVAKLADQDLPEMFRWDISPEGLDGLIYRGRNLEDSEPLVRQWADYLGVGEIDHEDRDTGYSALSIKTVYQGVPVRVRASYQTPASAEQAEDGAE